MCSKCIMKKKKLQRSFTAQSSYELGGGGAGISTAGGGNGNGSPTASMSSIPSVTSGATNASGPSSSPLSSPRGAAPSTSSGVCTQTRAKMEPFA